jgi:hypothetical protein
MHEGTISIFQLRYDPTKQCIISKKICKKLHTIITNSLLLKYHIELGVAGYIDNSNVISNPTQRLHLLSSRVRYWKEMTWSERISSQTPGAIYGFLTQSCTRGIIIRQISSASVNLNTLSTGTVSDSSGSGSGSTRMKYYEMKHINQRSTDSGPNPEQPTHIFTIPLDQEILAFDPGQDLLITISYLKYV